MTSAYVIYHEHRGFVAGLLADEDWHQVTYSRVLAGAKMFVSEQAAGLWLGFYCDSLCEIREVGLV